MIISCLLTALACVGLFALSISVVSAAEPRRVLLLHAFGHSYSPWSDMAGSFRGELVKQSPDPVDLYEVSLDTARIQDPKDEAPFVEYIRALVSGRKLDLIVPVVHSEHMLKKLKDAGTTAELITVSGEGHGWNGRAMTRSTNDALTFLDAHLQGKK